MCYLHSSKLRCGSNARWYKWFIPHRSFQLLWCYTEHLRYFSFFILFLPSRLFFIYMVNNSTLLPHRHLSLFADDSLLWLWASCPLPSCPDSHPDVISWLTPGSKGCDITWANSLKPMTARLEGRAAHCNIASCSETGHRKVPETDLTSLGIIIPSQIPYPDISVREMS